MIKFKACPRCKTGDVVTASDIYGRYAMCLQCGHVADLEYQAATRAAGRLGHRASVPSEVA